MTAPHRLARVRLVLLMAVSLAAGACHIPPLSLFFGGESQMQVTIAPQLNGNAPVAVEVIFAYDKALYQQLLTMDAKTWFAQRSQFIKDHASGKPLFDSWMWQWVPGQTVAPVDLEYHVGNRGGVIFAGYASAGSHRQTFDPEQDLRLQLGDTDFTVSQGK